MKYKNINLYFIFVIVTLFVSFPHVESTSRWTTGVGANNHFYWYYYTNFYSLNDLITYIQNVPLPVDVLQACPTCKAYYGTINSEEEINYIVKTFQTSYCYFFSASRREDPSLFKYVSGPEVNLTLYNVPRGQSALFSAVPSTAIYEDITNYENLCLHGSSKLFVNSASPFGPSNYYYLVEASDQYEPYIPPVETTGGDLKIKNLDKFVLDNIEIYVTPLGMDPIGPIEIVSRDPQYKTVVIKMPEVTGNGINQINITDGFQNYFLPYWKYKAPWAQSIYPAFKSSELITVVGENFGIDQTLLTVTTGTSSNECRYPKIIEPHISFSCQLTHYVNSDTPLLPITIKYGESSVIKTDKIGIYDATSIKMFRYLPSLSSNYGILNVVDKAYKNGNKIDSNTAYLTYYETQAQFQFYLSTFPTVLYSAKNLFTGLINDGVNGAFVRNSGGYGDGTQVTNKSSCLAGVIYCPSGSYGGAWNVAGSGAYYSASSATLITPQYNWTIAAGSLLAYGGIPTILPNNYTIDSGGGLVLVQVNYGYVGFKYTKRSYMINNVTINLPIQVISPDTLGIPIPPGTALQFEITLQIENYTYPGISVNYTSPSIISVASPTTLGGMITIFGYSFGIDPSIIQVTIDSVPCENIIIVTNHTAIACEVQPGVGGNKQLLVTIGTFQLNTTFSYLPPTIQSITQLNTDLTITGLSMGTSSNLPTVYVPYNITPTMTLSEPQILTMSVPVYAQNGKITVSVGNLNGTYSYVFQPYVDSITPLTSTEGNMVSIVGRFLTQYRIDRTQTSTKILIGGRQCTGPDFSFDVNNTYIKCQAPVGSGSNNDFYITIDGKYSNIIKVAYPVPTIVSYQQSSTTLTIIGANLGPDLNKSKVEINGNLFQPSFISTNPSRLVVTIPISTKNGYIRVKIDGQNSNSLNLTLNPTLINITRAPIVGGPITILGQFFNLQDYLNQDLNYTIQIGNGPCSNIQFPTNAKIICQVSPGTGIKEFTLTIGTFILESEYRYIAPVITGILMLSSDVVQINGTNISQDMGIDSLNVYQGTYNNYVGIEPDTIDYHTWGSSLNFTLPNDAFNGEISITVDGLTSPTVYMRMKPYITSIISDIPTSGGDITINGGHFAFVQGGTNQTLYYYVIASGNYCYNIKVISFNQIKCYATYSYGTQSAYVYIDNIPSAPFKGVHYLAPTLNTSVIGGVGNNYLYITGDNFSIYAGALKFIFGNLTSTPYSIDYKSSYTLIPKFAKNGDIYINVGGQLSNNLTLTLIPSIVSTTSVDFVGGLLTITGNFLNTHRQDGSSTSPTVYFPGNIPCEDVQQLPNDLIASRTLISCIAPPGIGTDLPLVVTIDGLNVTTLFTYGVPVLKSFTTDKSNIVSLYGENFGTNSTGIKVLLGAIPMTIATIQNDKITFQAPLTAHNDIVTLALVSNGKTSESIPIRLYPMLTSVTSSETIGSKVTIIGNYLNPTREYNRPSEVLAYFNKLQGEVVYMNANNNTMMLAIPPRGIGTNLNLTVSIDGYTATINTFNYQAPIISNNSQVVSVVYINGNNFGSNIQNIIMNPPSMIISGVSDKIIKLQLDPATSQNIIISFTVGGQTSNNYNLKLSPIISSLMPASPSGGNATVTGLYFNQFRSDGSATTMSMSVNGSNCPITEVLDNNKIIFTIPSGNIKGVPMVLTIDGMNTSSTYTVLGPQPISILNSTNYQVPAIITIFGSNFYTPLTIYIGDSQCTNPTLIDSTLISCYFAADVQPTLLPTPVTVYSVNLASTANIFTYTDIPCAIGCSLHGKCRNGACSCNIGFAGGICQTPVNLTVPVPTVSTYGGSIEIDDDKFNTEIAFIREISQFEITIDTIPLKDLTWVNEAFTIFDTYSLNVSRGFLDPEGFFIRVSTYYLNDGQIFEFAGERISVDSHSFKQTVEIQKWKFQDETNTLQVIYRSQVPNHVVSDCIGSLTTYTVYDSLATPNKPVLAFDFENLIAIYTVQFATRTILDGKITSLDVEEISPQDPVWNTRDGVLQSMIAINLPHFQVNATFDPTFSGHRKSNTVPCTKPSSTIITITSSTTATAGQSTNSQTTNGGTTGTGQTTAGQSTTGQSTTGQTTTQTTSTTSTTNGGTTGTGTGSGGTTIRPSATSSIPTTSSSSSTQTSGSIRTCPGTPVCSGHGLCDNEICYCYGQWTGTICDSEQDKIPPIKPDPTKPTTNSSKDELDFGIQVVAVQELDYMGKLIREVKLSNWAFDSIETETRLTYIYRTQPFKDDITLLDVTVDYFYLDSQVIFAGQTSVKKGGSLKYSINVTSWPFLKVVNQLQVIFSAQASDNSNNQESCTLKEIKYGDSSSDVETIFIQVNNKTFESQFSDLAVIDGSNMKIKNVVLQNNISDSGSMSSVLIGVVSPSFDNYITIDPDFSVLISHVPAQEKENSVCNSSNIKSTKKLSSGQLAGIIVGCVCFAVCVTVVTVYMVKKHIADKKLRESLSNKLKNFN